MNPKKPSFLCSIFAILVAAPVAQAVEVTVMYAYTPAVRNYVGTITQTETLITKDHVTVTGLQSNSATGVTMKRVGMVLVDDTVGNQDVWSQLNRLKSAAGFKDARAFRYANNVDLCQAYCSWTTDNMGGLSDTPGWASVIHLSLIGESNRSLVCSHEFSHSLNAYHDQGLCLSNGKKTLMPNTCRSNSIMNYLSTPLKKIDGITIGDSTHNNLQRVKNYAPTTAGLQ